jgi:hypothetical protein
MRTCTDAAALATFFLTIYRQPAPARPSITLYTGKRLRKAGVDERKGCISGTEPLAYLPKRGDRQIGLIL